MFMLVAFVIFTAALLAAAYYAWSVPQQQESDAISNRLRELRVRTGAPRKTTSADLLRTENRGTFAFIGDFRGWFRVLSRLQEMTRKREFILVKNFCTRSEDSNHSDAARRCPRAG